MYFIIEEICKYHR